MRLEEGGTYASPTSSVFPNPVPLHGLFPLPIMPFPPSPPETSHLCFHRLLSIGHTPSTLKPKQDNVLPLPLASCENGSLSALALITCAAWKKPGVRPQLAQGLTQPPLAEGHLRKWLKPPEPQFPHLENGKTVTLTVDAKIRFPIRVMCKESAPRETGRERGQQARSRKGVSKAVRAAGRAHRGKRHPAGEGILPRGPTPEGVKTPWQFWFSAGAGKEAPGTGGEAAEEESQLQAFEADANSCRGRGVRGHIRTVLCPLHHSLNLGVVWVTPWPWEVEAKTGLSYSGDLGLSEGRAGSPPSVSIKGHC